MHHLIIQTKFAIDVRTGNDLLVTSASRHFRTFIAVAPLVAGTGLAAWVLRGIEPWILMCAMTATILLGCKWLTWWSAEIHAPPSRHVGYLLGWPGMDAERFLSPSPKLQKPTRGEFLFAISKFLLGVALLLTATLLVDRNVIIAGWTALVGLSFLLLFGGFHVLSCVWRFRGVDAEPLMHNPAVSRSVGEFWGRRWNMAFRDIAFRFLFRPLTRRIGPAWATMVGFVVSGVAHEMAITFPAGAGYGRPTLFFVIQGIAMLVERRGLGARLRGHMWTVLVTAGSLAVLFPPEFFDRVIAPMIRAVRSWVT
ncbi:MAG: hypothetical protein H7144_01660 [Burkholderiales bacterium]|nr:hypothetical protein [Phycisphaerae bacterium]